MVSIDFYGTSFTIAASNAFEAGFYYSVLLTHAHGGGFCMDHVKKYDDGSYTIHEKHADGGHSLASALLGTMRAFGNDNPKFSDDAKTEINRRIDNHNRMMQARADRHAAQTFDSVLTQHR